MPALNLTELNAALRNVGARWEAAQPAEQHLLGYVPGPEDHSFEEREHLSRASYTRSWRWPLRRRRLPILLPSTGATSRHMRRCRPETM